MRDDQRRLGNKFISELSKFFSATETVSISLPESDKLPLNVSYISPPQPANNSTGSVPDAVLGSIRGSTPLAISPRSLSRRYSPPSGTVSSSSPSPPPGGVHQSPPASKIATISSSAALPTPPPTGDSQALPPGDNYSYVQLTTVHEDPPLIRATTRRDSTCSLKKRPALTTVGGGGGPGGVGGVGVVGGECAGLGTVLKSRLQCRYCQEFYSEEWNTRGACEYAPDCFRSMMDRIPGMQCARGLVYHCMSDSEGDTVAHPCECAAVDGACTKRWFGVALLSLLLPCLWCYPPLKACHMVGVSCGLCGSRHRPYV